MQKFEFYEILDSNYFSSLEHQISNQLCDYGINEFNNGFAVTFGMTMQRPEEDEKRKIPSDIF